MNIWMNKVIFHNLWKTYVEKFPSPFFMPAGKERRKTPKMKKKGKKGLTQDIVSHFPSSFAEALREVSARAPVRYS